jgi:hypothetical protein
MHTTHSGVTRATFLPGASPPRVQRASLGSPRVASPTSPNTVYGTPWTDDRTPNAIARDRGQALAGHKIDHDRPVCYPLRIYSDIRSNILNPRRYNAGTTWHLAPASDSVAAIRDFLSINFLETFLTLHLYRIAVEVDRLAGHNRSNRALAIGGRVDGPGSSYLLGQTWCQANQAWNSAGKGPMSRACPLITCFSARKVPIMIARTQLHACRYHRERDVIRMAQQPHWSWCLVQAGSAH